MRETFRRRVSDDLNQGLLGSIVADATEFPEAIRDPRVETRG